MSEQTNKPINSFGLHWWPASFRFGARWTRLEIYPTKIVYREGMIRKNERTIPLQKITDVSVSQGCFAGLLGFGNLYIETAGSGGTEVVIAGLEKISQARNAILAAMEGQGVGNG